MSQSHIQSFQQLFPGPYSLQPGINGVDSTFDIYCRKSGELIIETSYWYEEERAGRDASVITMALESMRHAHFPLVNLLDVRYANMHDNHRSGKQQGRSRKIDDIRAFSGLAL